MSTRPSLGLTGPKPEVEPRSVPSHPSLAWSDRWFQLRNRILANAAFQRWAAAFPLTRFIARYRAARLFDLVSGFVYSQVLRAGIELGLYRALEAGPRTAEALAQDFGLSPEACRALLDASVALRLLEARPGGRFGLGVLGAALLGNPALEAMVRHHDLFYADLRDPVRLLRRGGRDTELAAFWAYAGAARPAELRADSVASYSSLMATSQAMIADDIIDAYPMGRHRHLLDVAGGEGVFLARVAERIPQLQLSLFDLPPVAERARARLLETGLEQRVSVASGDLLRDALPVSADLVTLVRVIHDHDDEHALQILTRCRAALAPGGTLLVAEPMAETKGAEALSAYFGFYLRAMGQGRPRSVAELSALLARAGFEGARLCTTRRPMLVRVIRSNP